MNSSIAQTRTFFLSHPEQAAEMSCGDKNAYRILHKVYGEIRKDGLRLGLSFSFATNYYSLTDYYYRAVCPRKSPLCSHLKN